MGEINMNTTKTTMKNLREENRNLRNAIKDIVYLIKTKPYSHNQDIFDIAASFGVHENLIKG